MTDFGRYTVQRVLGRGAAADAFLCTDGGRSVVVKARAVNDPQLRARIAADPALEERSVARFLAERDLLDALRHPNVVELLDAGTTDTGTPYFVMPFLKTGLVDVLRPLDVATEPRVTRAVAISLLQGVLSGLAPAHERGVVHRDLRPANVRVIGESGMAVVCDFGSAKSPALGGQWFRPVGVRPFASPEQLVDSDAADARADVYAVGVLAHLMFTGHLPGPAAIASGALHRRVGDALGDWVAAAMNPVRERRLANAGAALVTLNLAAGA